MTIQQNPFPIPQNPVNHSKGLADLDVCPDQSSQIAKKMFLITRILLQASRVVVTRAETLKPLPHNDDLVFGKVASLL